MNDILNIMPKMIMGSELSDRLSILPKYDADIRSRSVPERLVALQDMYQIYVPNAMSREIYSKLYLSLLRSLQKKQSIFAVRQYHENNKMIRQQSYESIVGGSDSFTIIGPSGIGKSSAVSRAVNILTEHPVLDLSNTNVIACLQVQAPADCSVKGLLLEILRKADEMLRTSYHENAIKSHATVDMLIGSVSQVALNHVGLLIVDEIQNVVNSKNGKTIVGTLTQLINNSGVSICMVGTPESTVFFDQAMMLARRSLGLNYTMMEYDEEFCEFCQTLLQYCYVQETPRIDEALLMWLYNHSAGNASVVVGLLHDAQEIAILDGKERLDITTLNIAYEKRMTLLHDFIAPKQIKGRQLKQTSIELPGIEEGSRISDVCIYQISMNAKEFHNDIVTELMKNNIRILEVAI